MVKNNYYLVCQAGSFTCSIKQTASQTKTGLYTELLNDLTLTVNQNRSKGGQTTLAQRHLPPKKDQYSVAI